MSGLAAFYEEKIGLARLAESEDRISLGAGEAAFLHIDSAPLGIPEPPEAAGLFHTAFLLPDRASLGRWFLRAQGLGVPFEGASDHGVSDAFYLSDPEGNGIEVYADHPRSSWVHDADGGVSMKTAPMDVAAVVAEGRANGAGDGRFPDDARIGHVHLKVGDATEAERFYADRFRLAVTHRRPPHAVFLAAGGYHHHLAANTWASRGAVRRPDGALGLSEIALAVTEPALFEAITQGPGGAEAIDPWGNRLRIQRSEPT
jgi:catechol 2,3-dioxygenase